jgi:FixJ family two-component response regulator
MTSVPVVFVIDDDPAVREGLALSLTEAGHRVQAFASAEDFLARARPAGACCLVLDVRMPGLNGLDLQTALAEAGRPMSIVFCTGYADVPLGITAMKGGAVDFLTKPVDTRDLLDAVARALAKDAQELATRARLAEVQDRVKTLTPREAQVFARVVAGEPNKQIAWELGITERTVKAHRARVMGKMQARSLADLVRLADLAGVILPKPDRGRSSLLR